MSGVSGTSAASIAGLGSAGAAGAAPAAADPSAAAGAGAVDPTAAAGGAAPAAGAGAPAGGAAAKGAGLLGSLTKIPFLGPALAVAGGGLAMFAFHDPKGATWLKAAGIGMAGSGLALTYTGAKAKGIEAGQQQLATAITPQVQALEQQLEQSQAQNQQLVDKFKEMQQGQSGGGATDGSGSGGTTGGDSASAPLPGMPGSTGGTAGTAPSGTAPTQGQSIPDASWSPQAIVGQAIQLPQGDAQVAASGSFALAAVLGDPNGYGSLAEADQVATAAMSMDGSNVNAQRWIVVSHGGKFYAFQGQVDTDGIVPVLPQSNGQAVGYHAIRYVQGAQGGSWMQTGWSPTGGGVTAPFSGTGTPIGGAAPPAGGATTAPAATAPADAAPGAQAGAVTSGGATTPAVGSTVNGVTYLPGGTTSGTPTSGAQPAATAAGGATGSQPAPGAAAPVSGGGPAATTAPAFDPKTLVGSGFQLNAAQAGTTPVAGGWLQLLAPASGGFATPGDAAVSARASRTLNIKPNDAFHRYVTLRAGDGKYYAYEASIVNAAVPSLANAAPAHIFGSGFAEYFDGTTWRAQADG